MDGVTYNNKSILEKYDSTPTTDSSNLVNSGVVKQYVDYEVADIRSDVDDMIDRVGNPFVFKGTKAAISALPSSGNTINDCWFVEETGFIYCWNGTEWSKASTDVNNQLAHCIAEEYSDQKVYKQGELVIYNNAVYIRKSDATTQEGTFVSDNWTQTNIGNQLYEEVTNLKSACKDIIEQIDGNEILWFTWEKGWWGDNPNNTRSDYARAKESIPAVKGDKIFFDTSKMNFNYYGFYVSTYDSEGTYLTQNYFRKPNTTNGKYTITLTHENANFIRIHAWSGNGSTPFDRNDLSNLIIIKNYKSPISKRVETISNNQIENDVKIRSLVPNLKNDIGLQTTIPYTLNYGYDTSHSNRDDYVSNYENYIEVEPNQSITFDFTLLTKSQFTYYVGSINISFYNENNEKVGGTSYSRVSIKNRIVTVSIPENTKYLFFYIWTNNTSKVQDINMYYNSLLIYINKNYTNPKNKIENSILQLNTGKRVITSNLKSVLIENAYEYFYNLSQSYIDTMDDVIKEWMYEYAGDIRKIPFIAHTDHHASLGTSTKHIFDLLSYLVNWDNVSAIFNLGDVVGDHWADYITTSTSGTNILNNSHLRDAIYSLQNIPKNKQINVIGNHDTWYFGTAFDHIPGVLPSLKYLNPLFFSDPARTERYPDNSGNMVIYDSIYMVKYVVIANWDYINTGNNSYNKTRTNSTHWKWIINQLEKNDGYDIVIVSHISLYLSKNTALDPITGELTNYNITFQSGYQHVFSDRKNKVSGSIDVDGETISYDFSSCETNCFCSLSGHTHYDAVDYTDGLLVAAFDRFGPTYKSIHFGLIDRENEKLCVWKLHEGDTPGWSYWEAPFDRTL